MKFYTVHRPKEHSAHALDGRVMVPPQATEIELVQELGRLGIDLKECHYYNNRGNERFMAVNWEQLK